MASEHPQPAPTETQTDLKSAARPPWLLLVVGGLLVILGLVALVASFAATLATVVLFGVFVLLGGVAHLLDVLASRDLGAAGPRAMLGFLYLLVGGLMVFDPKGMAVSLTLLIAIFFLVAGVSRLVLASQFPTKGRAWLLGNGALNLLMAALIWIGWPESGTWVIGLFVGIELFLGGLALLLFAFGARRYLALIREQQNRPSS